MSEPKYAYRLPPCPPYDLEGMEGWLEDMAAKGLHLSREGTFAGFLIFEKHPPRAIRYRIQPFTKKETLFSDGGPDAAAVELAEAYGWNLIANRGMYAIYANEDPDAPELDTDPVVQAMTVDRQIRKCRKDLIVSMVLEAVVLGLLSWNGLLSFFLASPLWYSLTLISVFAAALLLSLHEIRHLKRLRTKLRTGTPLSGSRRYPRFYRALHLLSLALVCSVWLVLLMNTFFDWDTGRWAPADQTVLPFGNMQTLAEGEFEPSPLSDRACHFARRSTVIAAEQISFQQWGQLQSDGQTVLGGSLQVDYIELRTAWLAALLYDELLRQGQRHKYYDGLYELPPLETDAAAAFANRSPILLLREGNRVLRIQFSQYGADAPMPLEIWSAAMAAQFLS